MKSMILKVLDIMIKNVGKCRIFLGKSREIIRSQPNYDRVNADLCIDSLTTKNVN